MIGGQEWQSWLARHGPGMLLLARQWAASPADAEDIVQEAFLRFWRSSERHDARSVAGSVADPVAYLFASVKHAAMDFQRGGRRRVRREEAVAFARSETAGGGPMFSSPLEQAERRLAVEAALATLPEPQREVLVLKIWAGLTFPQIARALDVPPDTAASRYRYALEKLRTQLVQEVAP